MASKSLCGPLLKSKLRAVPSFQCEQTVASILYGGACSHLRMFSTSKKSSPSSKNIYFSNTVFDTNIIWIQNTYLMWLRTLAHFWNNLPDITLWQWAPFSGFTQPFVVGKLRKHWIWERHNHRVYPVCWSVTKCHWAKFQLWVVGKGWWCLWLWGGLVICWWLRLTVGTVLYLFNKFIAALLITCVWVYSLNSLSNWLLTSYWIPHHLIDLNKIFDISLKKKKVKS